MTDPIPTHASDDELATLYLRDRDTPCPKCNYNRRDATTSTCPECNEPFVLIGIGTQQDTRFNMLAESILLITWLYALVNLVRDLLSVKFLFEVANGSVAINNPTEYIITWSIRLAIWLAVLVLALIAWRKARRKVNISVATVTLPLKIIVVYFLLVSIYYSIRHFF